MGLRDLPSLKLPQDAGRRIFAREVGERYRARTTATGEEWEPWEKEVFSQKARAGDKIWGIYDIRGSTGAGSYPTGSPLFYGDDIELDSAPEFDPNDLFYPSDHPRAGQMKAVPTNPISSHGPGVQSEYRRLSRAMQRNDPDAKIGIGWSGHYTGPSRAVENYADPRHVGIEPVGESALRLAQLNKEQRGFVFPEQGSKAEADEIAAFGHEGWRKSYVERGGNPVPLPDDCVELVSLTPAGPIYTSSGLPGCP